MLYLNSLENIAASKTEKRYAISHETVQGMPNILELVPSKELLSQWQSQAINWEEFRKRFREEMVAEYRKGEKSRLRGLADYSLKNDVTLHSPEPPGEQTYRAILGEFVNSIWQRDGRTERVIDLTRAPVEEALLTEADIRKMEEIAAKCELFTTMHPTSQRRTCKVCKHLDQQVYLCHETKQVVIDYEWLVPHWTGDQQDVKREA